MSKISGNTDAEWELAIKGGNIRRLKTLARHKIKPCPVAMLYALTCKRPDLLPLLAEAGADPNQKNRYGETPLGRAVMEFDSSVVESLLKLGANPQMESLLSTPLNDAARFGKTDIMQVLLRHGANPNAPQPSGVTALIAAARYGYKEIVQMLLEAGAEPLAVGPDEKTAYEIAVETNQHAVAELLAPVSRLKKTRQRNSIDLLLEAIEKRDTAGVDRILSTGADVNRQDKHGRKPLMVAIGLDSAEIVQCLLKAGADPNLADDGLSPLDYAVTRLQPEIVEALLNAGAKACTPGLLSPACTMGNLRIAKMLLNAGYSPSEPSATGETPLMSAIFARSPEVVELLIERGADVNACTQDGWSALFFAITAGGTQFIQQRLRSGSNVMWAEPQPQQREDERARQIVKLLLAHGADVNRPNKEGRTPLTYAMSAEMARLLTQAGARLDIRDKRGHHVLYWLARNGVTNVQAALPMASASKALARRSGQKRSRLKKIGRRRGD